MHGNLPRHKGEAEVAEKETLRGHLRRQSIARDDLVNRKFVVFPISVIIVVAQAWFILSLTKGLTGGGSTIYPEPDEGSGRPGKRELL